MLRFKGQQMNAFGHGQGQFLAEGAHVERAIGI